MAGVQTGPQGCQARQVTSNNTLFYSLFFDSVVPEVSCHDKQDVIFYEPQASTRVRSANTFKCNVEKTTNCKAVSRTDCKQITWNECQEVPIPRCRPVKVQVPKQELLHRKKCLFGTSRQKPGKGNKYHLKKQENSGSKLANIIKSKS